MVEQIKSASQKTIEILAIPKTSLLLKQIRIRLLIIAGCCGIILLILLLGQSHQAGEIFPIIYIALTASFICLLHLFVIFPVYLKARRLDNSGTLALVTLQIKSQAQVHENIRNRRRVLDFFFLEFELPKGILVKSAVSKDFFETVSEGDSLIILYMEDAPTIQRVERGLPNKNIKRL